MNQCRVLVGLSCNFSCSYCCNHLPGMIGKFKEVLPSDYPDIVNKYDSISISGGEPLIGINIPLTMELLREAKAFGKKVYLYTNLSKLPLKHLSELVQTIDGWSIGVHAQSHGLEGHLRLITALGAKNIRLLVEESKANDWIPLSKELNFTVKPYTLNDCDISHREDWYKTKRAS